MHAYSEPEIEKPPDNDNGTSIFDAETQSGNEHSPNDNETDNDEVHEDSQPTNEKEPWVQKPMPFPPKSTKKKDDEEFECFSEMLRPVFLRTHLTDILKMAPYAKYMKDIIITNRRKIPEAEISTMLANYSFKDVSQASTQKD